MKPAQAAKEPTAPLLLTPRHEQILQAVYEYRYVTAQDIATLLFSKGSLTYARSNCPHWQAAKTRPRGNISIASHFPQAPPAIGNGFLRLARLAVIF